MSGKTGSNIDDKEQEYQYTLPWVTPAGHELSFYDTPGNERMVIKHASGSSIEFQSDGSIFVKSLKDVHTHSSVLSREGQNASEADNTTNRIDTDYTWEVGGRLRIKCSELDFEIGDSGKIYAGTDLMMTANNVHTKANENVSLQGTKSIYLDTKELRERSVSRQTENGTKEDGGKGGLNVMKVHGNTVIQNDDPNGGITIASQGYLNLVCGKERVDLVGMYTPTPATFAKATFTTSVFANKGVLDVSTAPGDVFFSSDAGAFYQYALKMPGSSLSKTDGFYQGVTLGNRTRLVSAGLENVAITGTQTIKAAMIFLN